MEGYICVCIDCDGTLVPTEIYENVYNQMSEKFNLPIPYEKFREDVYYDARFMVSFFRRLVPELKRWKIWELSHAIGSALERLCSVMDVFILTENYGADYVLSLLYGIDIELIVANSKRTLEEVNWIRRELGLPSLRRIFPTKAEALRSLTKRYWGVLFIGDSKADHEAAMRAGIPFTHATYANIVDVMLHLANWIRRKDSLLRRLEIE